MLARSSVDRLWLEKVGSRRMFALDEIKRLQLLVEEAELPWRLVHELYLTSKYWVRLRELAEKRLPRVCVGCKAAKFLHLDHKRYPGMGAETLDDVQWLCVQCHAEKTVRYDVRAWGAGKRLLFVGSDEQLFEILRDPLVRRKPSEHGIRRF